MNPYKIDDADPISVLSFLGQVERACDSNGVSEKVAMWLLQFSIKKFQAASLTIRLTRKQGDDIPNMMDRGRDEQERIHTYIEAVNYLLRSYATDDAKARASSKTESLKKLTHQNAVQYAKVLKNKSL